nr:acylphosphatase [Vagococcus lutrae]
MVKKIRLTVYGRVQGVGFRYMTKFVADQYGIKGLVKNQADGSVYIEASGSPERIALFIQKIKASPTPSGRVDDYELEYDDTLPTYSSFKVTY